MAFEGGTRMGSLSVFLHKKSIYCYSFYLSGSVNKFVHFCVLYWFLKMAIRISHSHFVHGCCVKPSFANS